MKILWNGIKSEGRLAKAHYSGGQLLNHSAGTVSVYFGTFNLTPEIVQELRPSDDSDAMTDYYELPVARVEPSHPLYAEVKAALDEQNAHRARMDAKRRERMVARMVAAHALDYQAPTARRTAR